MLTPVKEFLAKQARMPYGWFGRLVAPRVFNKENKAMEAFAYELVKPEKADTLLEIGFGNGRLISEIMSLIDEGKVYGVELSEAMLDRARAKNKQWLEHGKLELKQGSVTELPYPDATFDKVFTVNTIYFWPDPENNLKEIKRVLKPGGYFICVMRLKDQMTALNGPFKNSIVTNNRAIFENLFDGGAAKALFESAGFQEVRVQSKPTQEGSLNAVTGFNS